ncbi:MAG TPA: hypothetical protein VFX97_16845 [Pyrinomonadaceae bacterium]|nr:hypothetical protein [Pyrinomonadaceae bacterium]
MALNPTQIANLVEITREDLEDVESAVSAITSAQETILAADIVSWNLKRNSIANLKGKVNYDAVDLLARIFYRVRDMLGFDEIAFTVDPGANLEMLELETGVNFG